MQNPYGLIAILLFLWGSFAAVSKMVLQDIGNWQMQIYFFGIALVILLILLPFKSNARQLATLGMRRTLRLCGYGFLSYLYYAFYTSALGLVPAVEAAMINYLFPIFIVLFAVWLKRERMTVSKVLLILSAFIGTYIIITNGNLFSFSFTNIGGDLFALAGALCWGLFSVLGSRENAPIFASVFIYVAVSFACALVALLLFSSWVVPNWKALAGIGWLSISSVLLNYRLWFQLLKVSSASLVSGLSFLTPFVTLLFIVVLLGEPISWYQLGGFVWILISVYIQGRIEARGKIVHQKEFKQL